MKTNRKFAAFLPAFVLVLVGVTGCQSLEPAIDSNAVKEVARLSTLDCYYHSVAKFERDADGGIFEFFNIGYKRMWFEVDSWVKVGVDLDRVDISVQDDGTVVVKLPPAEIQGEPSVDESTMTTPITEAGPFTDPPTHEERMEALKYTLEKVKESAQQDDALLARGRERAKITIERYIENMGNLEKRDYKVVFENVA